jgi:hypothetical protein
MAKHIVELKNSISTDTVNEDIYGFDNNAAPLVENTGIHKLGGITNLYETETIFGDGGAHYYTDDGKMLAVVANGDGTSAVKVDGQVIGAVSSYGVENRSEFKGFDDVALTADGKVVTCKINSNVITLSEYSIVGALIRSRPITFTYATALTQFFTSLSFVRYAAMLYNDSQEFGLRLGERVVILKESTPNMVFGNGVTSTNITAAATSVCCLYNGTIVFGSFTTGEIYSFDGTGWRYPNGSGAGIGVYNNGSAVGNNPITGMVEYNGRLIIASRDLLACYNGSSWQAYNSGTPFTDTGTLIGGPLGASVLIVYKNLVVLGGNGKIGSIDSAGTKYLYNTTTANIPTNNQTALSATAINYSVAADSQFLVLGGNNGRIASYDGTNWKNYDGTGTGTGPYNNGTVGVLDVTACAKYKTQFVFSTTNGVSSWDGTNWKYYNGTGTGTGIFVAGATLNNSQALSTIVVNGNEIIFISRTNCASYDGTNWKYYNGGGTGTGHYISSFLGFVSVFTSAIYNSIIVIAGSVSPTSAQAVNSFVSLNSIYPFYTNGTTPVSNLLTGQTTSSYLYVYRYENGEYLVNLVNNNLNRMWILNNSTLAITQNNGRYCWPQVSGGKTRHIVTETPRFTGANMIVFSLVGYTDFVTYSGTQVVQTNGLVLSSISKSAIGWNYADATFKQTLSATNVYNYYGPVPQRQSAAFYTIYQGNTDTLITGNSKLTNGAGVVPVVPFEFRANLIAARNNPGNQSFLSVAILDNSASDALGTIITGLGEFDDTYQPQIVNDDTIMYLYNGGWSVVKIGLTVTERIQRIDSRLYKINTIAPYNIVDSQSKRLELGSIDYNGKMIYASTAAPAGSTPVVSNIVAKYCNSIDAGDRDVQIPSPGTASISVFGYRIPIINSILSDYKVDTYINDLYSFSTYTDGSELVLSDPASPIYVSDSRIPVPIGVIYKQGVVINGQITIFLDKNYDGYVVGNDTSGTYEPFVLFGQTYLFDGLSIYQATFSGNLLSSLDKICDAYGMQYIAISPIEAYFLSNFDNSMYSFTGGRNLSKTKAFTSLNAIASGTYSTLDGSLLFDSTGHLIWVRDGLASQNAKKPTQTDLRLFTTSDGIILANDYGAWQYTYYPQAGSTVVPLSFQTAYFGMTANQKSILKSWVVTIYNDRRDVVRILTTERAIDQDDQYEHSATFTLTAKDFDSRGYAIIRVQPKYQRSLGSSLQIDCAEKIVVLEISSEFEDSNTAVMAANKSR